MDQVEGLKQWQFYLCTLWYIPTIKTKKVPYIHLIGRAGSVALVGNKWLIASEAGLLLFLVDIYEHNRVNTQHLTLHVPGS